jgi:hypothetical protein
MCPEGGNPRRADSRIRLPFHGQLFRFLLILVQVHGCIIGDADAGDPHWLSFPNQAYDFENPTATGQGWREILFPKMRGIFE